VAATATVAAVEAMGTQLRSGQTMTPSARWWTLLQLMQTNGFTDYEDE